MGSFGESSKERLPYIALSEQLEAIDQELKAASMLSERFLPALKTSLIRHAIEVESKNGPTLDIDAYFEQMLKSHNQDEFSLRYIAELIYYIVKTMSYTCASNFELTSGWTGVLVDLLFSRKWSKVLLSDMLLCLKVYSKSYNDKGIFDKLRRKLLININKSDKTTLNATYVLIHFFDDLINENLEIFDDVERLAYKLLISEDIVERKAALYLMKKMNTRGDMDAKNFWLSYITILENLEENQSHLILPSLENIRQKYFRNNGFKKWQDILYIKLLSHQNIMIIRWALVYILETLTCSDLSPDVLLEFVRASNHTCLYNCEGFFIPTNNIKKFLSGDVCRFMENMAEVNFRSVPLHFWLNQICIYKRNGKINSKELLLKLAARIRVLQNPLLRIKVIRLCEDIFHEVMNYMRLSEYIVLVETLYNVTDPFNNFRIFCEKLKISMDNGYSFTISERFYEIITNNLNDEFAYIESYIKCKHTNDDNELYANVKQSVLLYELVNYIKGMDQEEKSKHKWILLMIVFESENKKDVQNVCQNFWDLSIDNFIDIPYQEICDEILSKLVDDEVTVAFVRKKFPDFFVKEYIKTFSHLYKYMAKIEDILTAGSYKTLEKLSELIANTTEIIDFSIIDSFLKELKGRSRKQSLCYTVTTNLLKYLKVQCSPSQIQDYANKIICSNIENIGICTAILNSDIVLKNETYIEGILMGDVNFGDARIEDIYLLSLEKKHGPRLQQMRMHFASSVPLDCAITILSQLFGKLKGLSLRKPRYFENSMEHRMKLRILRTIISLMPKARCSNEDIYNLLLNYNDQLNISYIYELLVALVMCDSHNDIILKKLDKIKNYTPSQQVSLISIVHCYIVLNRRTLGEEELSAIIHKLLSLTMGTHFQTRLYAQLVLYKILDNKKNNVDEKTVYHNYLKDAIASAIYPQLNELLEDVRVLLPYIYLSNPDNFFNIILFITMAPSDEYLSNFDYSKYQKSRNLFAKKISKVLRETDSLNQIKCDKSKLINMQRKMNPEQDLYAMSSITDVDISEDSQMFVVASLIDKIPNIGGIARTCEVLGIRNLVLSSKKLIEKQDFKSVSMTAEKNLNIFEVTPSNLEEFIKEKQADGFEIVGAEQTVDSKNLVQFAFPRKCILILGHEKEGIPSNILGFLDHTIEIPQFGILRSLNVHVTGALFMWEYCKQHIVESSTET